MPQMKQLPVWRFISTAAPTTFIVAVKDLPDRSTAATQLAVRQAPVRISTPHLVRIPPSEATSKQEKPLSDRGWII
jgi:hypothetical protein